MPPEHQVVRLDPLQSVYVHLRQSKQLNQEQLKDIESLIKSSLVAFPPPNPMMGQGPSPHIPIIVSLAHEAQIPSAADQIEMEVSLVYLNKAANDNRVVAGILTFDLGLFTDIPRQARQCPVVDYSMVSQPFVFSDEKRSAILPKNVAEIQSILSAGVYQAIHSINVSIVQSELAQLRLLPRERLFVPLVDFGPMLLLATRVCCSPIPCSPPVVGKCAGCGSAPHDLLTRAYSAYLQEGSNSSSSHDDLPEKLIAVEIPSSWSEVDSIKVVSHERDYVFGIAHSGHLPWVENPWNAIMKVSRSDWGDKGKGYAMQTHIKGLNFIMRMAQKGGDALPKRQFQYEFGTATFAIATLASRESSTHANQFVPQSGLQILPSRAFTDVQTISVEKGTEEGSNFPIKVPTDTPLAITRGGHTGLSTGAASASANPLAQKALSFDVIGRLVELVGGEARPLSSLDFVRPYQGSKTAGESLSLRQIANAEFRTPIVVVSGTSAEAGKSTFAKKVMSSLKLIDRAEWSARYGGAANCASGPLRVAYVKATGTSSWGDTIQAQRVGVTAAYDQLDCGLPTTYAKISHAESTAGSFDQLSQLSLSFLHAQADGADVIVTELGGDIIFAKNPELLSQQWFWKNALKCFVICNDSMAAVGVVYFLGLSGGVLFEGKNNGTEAGNGQSRSNSSLTTILEENVPFPIQFVASPFRTYDGAVARAAMLGLPAFMNPNIELQNLKDYFIQ